MDFMFGVETWVANPTVLLPEYPGCLLTLNLFNTDIIQWNNFQFSRYVAPACTNSL